jgi:RNA recognition motif-containing protein
MSSDGKPTADEEGRRLFVSKLSGATDADRLREAFAPFGTLLDAQIAKPGLGHVTFEDVECASRALDRMQGVIVDGYEIGVRRPRSYFIRAEQQVKMGLVQKQRQKEAKQSNDVREQARNLDASEGLGNGSDGVDDDVDVRLQRQREALKSQRNAGAASPFGVEEGARGARAREAEAAPRYLTDGARRRVIRYDEEEDDDEDDEDDDVWADFDRTFDEDDDWKDDGATAKDMERQAGSKWQDFKGKDKDFGWEDDEVSAHFALF